MTNAQLVLDKIQETICTEGTTYNGRSGSFKFITGKTTAEGTINGVVKKMHTGEDASVTWKTAGSFKVLVDGTAVLCCDDVDGKTNYGNVFEIGIQGVWNNLRSAHKLIFDKTYSKAKENLICNTCARARFKWSDSNKQSVVAQQTNVANQSNLPVTYS